MAAGPMTNIEARDWMRRCASEIKMLRARIDFLLPKADAYDKLSQLLDLLPRPSPIYGDDLAWDLERRMETLDGENAPVVVD